MLVNNTNTIKFSTDNGKTWKDCTTGGFAGGTGGTGVAYNPIDKMWVAVGDNNNQSGSIKFSTDNGKTWQDCTTGGFADFGLGIAYNPEDKRWIAVGDPA